MKFSLPTCSFAVLTAIALLAATEVGIAEDRYAVGRPVTAFSAKDQFGAPFKLDTDCRALLVSFDMATGKQANLKLSALGKDFLPKRRAVYVANIHGMPAIGRVFALPKMRSYAYRIVLADDPALLAPFPQREKRVTVMILRSGKITAIRYWDPAKDDIAKLLPNEFHSSP